MIQIYTFLVVKIFITFGFFESHKAPCSRNNNVDKLLLLMQYYYHTTVLLRLLITELLQFRDNKRNIKDVGGWFSAVMALILLEI